MPAADTVSQSVKGAPGAPVGTASATAPAVGQPFDAVLMLEELAASAAGTALDLGIDAGAAELGGDGELVADDGDDEDSIEDDPLAFLAGLLSIAAPTVAQQGSAGAAGEGGVELDAGGGSPAAQPDASGLPFLAGDPADAAQSGADAVAAARALAAQAALVTQDPGTKDDSSGAPTRAADLLAQSPRAPAALEHAPIVTHARDPRWADEFANRIAVQVNQRESVASLSLTPLDLGPVDVSVTVRDSQATIHFGAAQAETRALIEASLPKLRELLAAQGFQLMDASVSQGFRQSKPQAGPSVPRPSSVEDVTPLTTRSIVMNGLLDTYA